MLEKTAKGGKLKDQASGPFLFCSDQRDKVAILLATFNGEHYLAEQLESLARQTHQNWVVYASDDGSTDETLQILHRYQKHWGNKRLQIFEGPRKGFSANFLSLIRRQEVEAQYFAFCDQDDIWVPEKLSQALDWMMAIPASTPTLYCSRTRLIDESGALLGFSSKFIAPLTFRNALVQSIAGGNTMVFNEATQRLLSITKESSNIVSHDWWTYILVTGCGGQVRYDPEPRVDYRQHTNNLMGSNASIRDRWVRLRKLFAGTFREWNAANLAAIAPIRSRLTPECQETLLRFEQARDASLFKRLWLIRRARLYRQTFQGNVGLLLATLLRRL